MLEAPARSSAASTCSPTSPAIDYLHYPDATDRFGVVYALTNTTTGERLFVKTFVNDPDPALPSVVSLWNGADWMEREVYDMYGIDFAGHPDLRRILMPDEFTGFPAAEGLPAARPRRAAQLPAAHAGGGD